MSDFDMPTNFETSDIIPTGFGVDPNQRQVMATAMRAAVIGPQDPAYGDPAIQPWLRILSASTAYLPGPGLLDDTQSNSIPSEENPTSDTEPAQSTPPHADDAHDPANPEVAYAGTLIDQRYDGAVTHCTYERPGLPTFTVHVAGHVICDPTTPAPRG
jgi:hypothetical protein